MKNAWRNGLRGLAAAAFLAVAGAHAEPAPEAAPPPLWFEIGEQLVYTVRWGVIPVGKSVVTTDWADYEGRRLIAIRFVTKTSGFINSIYPVDDFLETLIDPVTFLPVRFIQKMNEGRHHSDEVTYFDHAAGVAKWESKVKNKTKEYPIDANTRDLISMMYYLRSKPFKPGEVTEHRVMADEKVYDLYLKTKDYENLDFDDFGKVRSLRIVPEAAFNGLFVRKGKMTVWVADDPRRIALSIKATVPVADVRITLAEVLGPGNDFWIQRSKPD